MSGIIYTPPAGAGIIPDLNTVMIAGNSTTQPYVGTGIGLATQTIVTSSYTPTPDDFLLLVDVSAGNVNINVPLSFYGILAIKLINYTPGNVCRVRIDPPGTIDGAGQYILTRQHGSIIIAQRNATDFVVLASNDGLGSVNSGRYTAPMFTGFVLSIPHTLNAIPTGVTIEPGDIDGLNLLSSVPYFITVTNTDININFTLGASSLNPFTIFWSVTRN
jgi:hypothetical protein